MLARVCPTNTWLARANTQVGIRPSGNVCWLAGLTHCQSTRSMLDVDPGLASGGGSLGCSIFLFAIILLLIFFLYKHMQSVFLFLLSGGRKKLPRDGKEYFSGFLLCVYVWKSTDTMFSYATDGNMLFWERFWSIFTECSLRKRLQLLEAQYRSLPGKITVV